MLLSTEVVAKWRGRAKKLSKQTSENGGKIKVLKKKKMLSFVDQKDFLKNKI